MMLAIFSGQLSKIGSSNETLSNTPQPSKNQVVKMNGLVPLVAQSPIWNEKQEKTMFDMCVKYLDMTMEDRCQVCRSYNSAKYEDANAEESDLNGSNGNLKFNLKGSRPQMKLTYGLDLKSEMIDEMIRIEDVELEDEDSALFNPFRNTQEDYMRSNTFKKRLKKTKTHVNFGELENNDESTKIIENFSEDEIVHFLNDEIGSFNDSLFKCQSQETGLNKKFTLVVNKSQLKEDSEDSGDPVYSVDSLNPF